MKTYRLKSLSHITHTSFALTVVTLFFCKIERYRYFSSWAIFLSESHIVHENFSELAFSSKMYFSFIVDDDVSVSEYSSENEVCPEKEVNYKNLNDILLTNFKKERNLDFSVTGKESKDTVVKRVSSRESN